MAITVTVYSSVPMVEVVITGTVYSSVPNIEMIITCHVNSIVSIVEMAITGTVNSSCITVEMATAGTIFGRWPLLTRYTVLIPRWSWTLLLWIQYFSRGRVVRYWLCKQ